QPAGRDRREPVAEDAAAVAVAGRAYDSRPDRARRLIERYEHEPLDDLRGPRASIRVGSDHLVHGRVDAPLLAARVRVESLPRLAAQPAAFYHAGERGHRCEPLAERLVHHPDHLLPYVHANLVQQGDRSDGETELDHQPVDLFDGHAFDEEMASLVHVGREDPVDPEAGTVLHDDGGLAHAAAEPDGGADDLRRGPRRW